MKFDNLKDVYKRPEKTKEYWQKHAKEVVDVDFESKVNHALYNHSWNVTIKAFIKNGLINNQSKVLEVGCGWGRVLVGLRKFCPKARIVGVDITEDFIQKSKLVLEREFGVCDVEVLQGDAMELDFEDEAFDTVVTTRVLQYVSNPAKSVCNIHRILKKEGRVVICLPNKWNPIRLLTYRTKLYSPKDINSWLKSAGFNVIKSSSIIFFPSTIYNFRENNIVINTIEKIFQKMPLMKHLGTMACVVGEKKSETKY